MPNIDTYKKTSKWSNFKNITSGLLYCDSPEFFGGEDIELSVNLRNLNEMTSLQTNIKLPKGCSFEMDEDGYVKVDLSDRATRTHKIETNIVDESTIQVIYYSSSNRSIKENDGTLFTVKLKTDWNTPVGKQNITLSNCELTESSGLILKNPDKKF